MAEIAVPRDPTLVAAIRLDESSTGWSLTHEDEISKGYGRASDPVPLKLLVEPNGQKINYIGYRAEAEYMYTHLRNNNSETGYYFFTNIVALLKKSFDNNVDENQVLITDVAGKCLPALDLFAMTIKFLKDELSYSRQMVLEEDIYFVIVVPALLQERREMNLITKAAYKAGIEDKMVSIVTDIVAVSFFYKFSSFQWSSSENQCLFVRLGDTMDIMTEGSMQKDGLKNMSTVKSFEDGMSLFEEAFENFMIKLFHKEVFEKFKASQQIDYTELMKDLGIKITTVSRKTGKVVIKVPHSLLSICTEITGENIKNTCMYRCRDVKILADKLQLPTSLFIGFFEELETRVLKHIREEIENTNSIIMFGKLAQSLVIQEGVKSIHQNTKVLSEAEILMGAVIAGTKHKPGQIVKLAPRTLIVAAIDFGTTYSGWAYSFYTDLKSDITKMFACTWNSGSILTPKTPTCLLVKPDGKTIEAFGYEAENRYKDLIEDNEHADYFYFRHFKMLLHRKLSEKMNRDITVEDEMGRSLPAIDVFSMSIRFLKDNLLETCNQRLSGREIETNDVQWVLTVPAIWNDGAKQFMRESAIKAGIESKRLTIALEPESASIYCRHQKIEASTSGSKGFSCLRKGTKYMILDAGGGTVDITVHEVEEQNKVKEVHAACGGDWGGTAVDKEFESVLIALVGTNNFQRFKNDSIEDYLELWRDFEIKKRTISPSSDRQITITIPLSLLYLFKDDTKEDFGGAITKSKYAEDVDLKNNKMKISANLMRSFFNNSINNILTFCKMTLEDINITAILMVGGYSESPMLQDAVKKTFPKFEVVVPTEPSYSIMKGALIFGYIPSIISKRILKYTYGIRSFDNFVKGKHPESKRQQTDDGEICTDIFCKHVEKDQEVTIGEMQVRRIYTTSYKKQKKINISVYASEKANPEYTDQDCHFVGKMILELSDDSDLGEKIEVALSFSNTEIVVVAKEMKTGRETHSAIDFLG